MIPWTLPCSLCSLMIMFTYDPSVPRKPEKCKLFSGYLTLEGLTTAEPRWTTTMTADSCECTHWSELSVFVDQEESTPLQFWSTTREISLTIHFWNSQECWCHSTLKLIFLMPIVINPSLIRDTVGRDNFIQLSSFSLIRQSGIKKNGFTNHILPSILGHLNAEQAHCLSLTIQRS